MNTHTIFWADDDPDDLELFCDVLSNLDGQHQLERFGNGLEVWNRLKEATTTELPCLIVLDLNMPVLNGRDTLERIKADIRLAKIPLVVFSTSSSEHDKKFCTDHGVELITKPVTYDRLLQVLVRLVDICVHQSIEEPEGEGIQPR